MFALNKINGLSHLNLSITGFFTARKYLADEAILIVAGLWNLKISA
ncbi:MAG: hypothetical protein VSS75_002645 [Candidatus Parabeggiatoa sp.]|nr:hypothetical protein [Candidatus Parabeggiatoa sp.]